MHHLVRHNNADWETTPAGTLCYQVQNTYYRKISRNPSLALALDCVPCEVCHWNCAWCWISSHPAPKDISLAGSRVLIVGSHCDLPTETGQCGSNSGRHYKCAKESAPRIEGRKCKAKPVVLVSAMVLHVILSDQLSQS